MAGRTATDYLRALKQLMPRGRAWTTNPDSWLAQVLYGMSGELARLDNRAYDMTAEITPSIADELLEEYEEDFWIDPSGLTDEERREVLHAKNILIGRQDKEYFIGLAEALGYSVTIDEFQPFWAGYSTAGSPCGGQLNLFYWLMNVDPNGDKGAFSVGFSWMGYDSIQASYKDYVMYSLIRAFWNLIDEIWPLRPGHTIALFDWHLRGYSRGFGWGFHAIPTDDQTCPLPGFGYGFSSGWNNLRTYDGEYLIGGFRHGFNLGFDTHFGGGFEPMAFADGFWCPA